MSRPKCPNHTCEMIKTDQKRMWICPISGARFEADSDDQTATKKYDKFGQPVVDWHIEQADGGTGG